MKNIPDVAEECNDVVNNSAERPVSKKKVITNDDSDDDA